jgi:hypothetical protein
LALLTLLTLLSLLALLTTLLAGLSAALVGCNMPTLLLTRIDLLTLLALASALSAFAAEVHLRLCRPGVLCFDAQIDVSIGGGDLRDAGVFDIGKRAQITFGLFQAELVDGVARAHEQDVPRPALTDDDGADLERGRVLDADRWAAGNQGGGKDAERDERAACHRHKLDSPISRSWPRWR